MDYTKDIKIQFGINKPDDYISQYIVTGIPPGAKVLEMGSWDGRNSIFLAKKGFRVLSVDNSEIVFERFGKHIKNKAYTNNIEIVKDSINTFRTNGKIFDLMYCCSYIFHLVGQTGVNNFIQQIKSGLKENGVAFLAFFTPRDLTRIEADRYYPTQKDILTFFGRNWKIQRSDVRIIEHAHQVDGQDQDHKHAVCRMLIKRNKNDI